MEEAKPAGTQLADAMFEDFAALLSKRLACHVPTTEDSVRYTFFASLLRAGFAPEQIVVEYKHPAIANAEVDTVILGNGGVPVVAIEFKYDRAGNSTSPKPQKAGALFYDLARLIRFEGVASRYFVYVTDAEMAAYLDKPEHGLQQFFRLSPGASLRIDGAFLQGRTATFHNRMGEWPGTAFLHSIRAGTLTITHHLRIFQLQLATGQAAV